jgi:hypothetical protein
VEEEICHIEIIKEDEEIVAKLESDLGGIREFRAFTYEELLKMLINELQEEFDFSSSPSIE